MKSLLFYIRLFFATLSINKNHRKAKSLVEQGKTEEKDKLVMETTKWWAKKTLDLTGSSIEIYGKENIPKDGAFLITPNHDSMFDISAILLAFDQSLSFVTKQENKRIPFVSKWLPLLDCIAIDRSSPKSSVKSLMNAVKLIKSGKSVVIFPEGTRSSDGSLGEFKAGSFKIAQKASTKVLPVAIMGTREIMRKGSLKISSSNVIVSILPAINTDDLNTNDLASLTKKVIKEEKIKWRNK